MIFPVVDSEAKCRASNRVNDSAQTISVHDANKPLLYVLRNKLRVTGVECTLPASLLFVITLLSADPTRADEAPAFRRGLWQFDRTVGGHALQTKSCSSPSEDMERQNAMLEKGGCKSSPGKRSGSVYSFTVECTVTTPGSGTVNVRSTSVMTMESDSAYQVDITTTGAGTSTQERLVARRIGDCAK